MWLEEDPGASYEPFTGNPELNIPPSQKDPNSYFELFFDPAMYTRISDETNNYARQRIQNVTGYLLYFTSIFTLLLLCIIDSHFTSLKLFFFLNYNIILILLHFYSTFTLNLFIFSQFLFPFCSFYIHIICVGGRDPIQLIDQSDYQKHHQLSKWTDINESDVKIFLAHVIVMGLVRKPTITKYWRKNELCTTPFFGRYMTRTQFERILANIHLVDNSIPSQDPLNKIRPMLNMIERNFMHVYTPKKNLSVDEASCPFKGRLGFKMYNPRKPARFHIHLYQVCEAESGYCIGLEVFTGNKNSECIKISRPIDPTSNVTTKLVLGLLEKCKLLD
ncbi:MAG: transposase, partial [Proteobacteria bacterium]|nr:transposase [Pseudomonadota bacterium]